MAELWELEGSGGRAREAGEGLGECREGRLCSCLEGLRLRVPRSGLCLLPCFPARGSCVILKQSLERPRRAFLAPGVQCPLPHSAGSDLQLGLAFPPGSDGSFTHSALLEPFSTPAGSWGHCLHTCTH